MKTYDPHTKRVQNARTLLRSKLKELGFNVPKRRSSRRIPQRLNDANEQLKELARTVCALVLFENNIPTVSCQHCKSITKPVITDGQSTTCADCLHDHTHEPGEYSLVSKDRLILESIVVKQSKDAVDYIEKMVALKLLIKRKYNINILYDHDVEERMLSEAERELLKRAEGDHGDV